ncbi:CSMD3 [Branchiostoma lanceolatum]|uniref:CSMD3 protein n=1 Tax=Branchiostoma lanceolatum TaxID=7740 RepID=A0A8K0ER66_BRALA|nr:CSMD3 [Branchiostoma lanceolatum]
MLLATAVLCSALVVQLFGEGKASVCSDPGIPDHGSRNVRAGQELYPGAVLRYNCDGGYVMVGSDKMQCLDSGAWQPPNPPMCRALACSIPDNIPNGKFGIMSKPESSGVLPYPQGTVIQYKCNRGYRLDGEEQMTCEEGRWSEETPTCVQICRHFEEIAHCQINVVSSHCVQNSYCYNGTVVEYHCDLGYFQMGPSRRACINGHWAGILDGSFTSDDTPPRCVPQCPTPRPIENGLVQSGQSDLKGPFLEGSEVTYHCSSGYTLIGPTMRRCISLAWTDQDPHCWKVCDPPETITHGDYADHKQTYRDGETVQYSCSPNYRLEGDSMRECLSTGSWSGMLPRCVWDPTAQGQPCQAPGQPVNGYHENPDRVYFNPREIVHFFCHNGYRLEGSDTMTCQPNGTWGGELPTCVMDTHSTHTDTPIPSTFSETWSIVAASAGSVLGILIIAVVIVAWQCRPGRRRLLTDCPPGHPFYFMDDSDQVGLLTMDPVAQGVHIALPSYEEACQEQGSQEPPPFQAVVEEGQNQSGAGGGEGTRTNRHFLPNIPNGEHNHRSQVNFVADMHSLPGGHGARDEQSSIGDSVASVETAPLSEESMSTSRQSTCGSLSSSKESLIDAEDNALDRQLEAMTPRLTFDTQDA